MNERVRLYERLIEENRRLRVENGHFPLQYRSPNGLSGLQLDTAIRDLIADNKELGETVFYDGPEYAEQEELDCLEASQSGCKFWVPLDGNAVQEKPPLPFDPSPPKIRVGCPKCEGTILLYARISWLNPGPLVLNPSSDEFKLLESWVRTSLKMNVTISRALGKHDARRFIAMERKMSNIRLGIYIADDVDTILQEGIVEPIALTYHLVNVGREIKEKGTSHFLVCAYDEGIKATNYCNHTTLPPDAIGESRGKYDSLEFKLFGKPAVYILNPSRVIPLYTLVVN